MSQATKSKGELRSAFTLREVRRRKVPAYLDRLGGQLQDRLNAVATETDGMWSFDVTILSPYDSPERYADAWRILGADGTVFGIRELTHDHASEQPFTRSLGGIAIPDTVTVVTIEGRDKEFGWGGTTLDVALSR